MGKKIVVVGSMNSDIILKVKRMPEQGETMPAQSAAMAAGGKGSNQAAQAAKLGAETYMIGAVGADSMGDFLLSEAKKCGVITDFIKRSKETTGMGIVHALEDGRVFSTINRGANFDLSCSDIDQNRELIESADILILQNEVPSDVNRYVIEIGRQSGAKILYNAAPAAEMDREHLGMCDVVIVNEVEASYYFGSKIVSAEAAKEEGLKAASELRNAWVITLGAFGSVMISGGKSEAIPSIPVNAIETTGAGDSYIGGLAYSLSEGKDLFEGGRFATRCSAVTVCGIGAQASMPRLKDVLSFQTE